MRGWVIKLDRGFPLVKIENGDRCGEEIRCQHATALVKQEKVRAVIGDNVEVSAPEDADMAQITKILPRTCTLVRRDPAERTEAQVMAANFDTVMIAEPADQLNLHRLERELVVAHETGARVVVLLTKMDLLSDSSDESKKRVRAIVRQAKDVAAPGDAIVPVSVYDKASIDEIRALIPEDSKAVLLGRSGVGKSSLVNALVGHDVQQTSAVRVSDGKGRHTTVSRQVIPIAGGGYIIDMPGTRGIGMWQSDKGIAAVFPDITALAEKCRFRDCSHHQEPGCAVRAAVEAGKLSQARLDSYHNLIEENNEQAQRAEVAKRIREHPGRPPRYSRHHGKR